MEQRRLVNVKKLSCLWIGVNSSRSDICDPCLCHQLQKRHNTRLLPKADGPSDRSGNILPGEEFQTEAAQMLWTSSFHLPPLHPQALLWTGPSAHHMSSISF